MRYLHLRLAVNIPRQTGRIVNRIPGAGCAVNEKMTDKRLERVNGIFSRQRHNKPLLFDDRHLLSRGRRR